jgi:hypothetical protein
MRLSLRRVPSPTQLPHESRLLEFKVISNVLLEVQSVPSVIVHPYLCFTAAFVAAQHCKAFSPISTNKADATFLDNFLVVVISMGFIDSDHVLVHVNAAEFVDFQARHLGDVITCDRREAVPVVIRLIQDRV